MAANEDPEDRIRELERPLADSARASEMGSSQPAGQRYPPGPAGPPQQAPPPWSYGAQFPGPAPQRPSGNRTWWILGSVIVIGVVALAGGIAALAAHQISGVKSIIVSPPTASRTVGAPPTTSPVSPPGAQLSVAGINENRTVACNDNIVSVSGVSNTVVITGHCTHLSVSGVKNAITIAAVDSIEASGFGNKVTYHSGTPKVDNSGDSNVVQQG
jgi:hypothetical protein